MPVRGKKTTTTTESRRILRNSELRRLTFANSDKLPIDVEICGYQMHWVGIGLVCHGVADGTEPLVVDDDVTDDAEALASSLPNRLTATAQLALKELVPGFELLSPSRDDKFREALLEIFRDIVKKSDQRLKRVRSTKVAR